MPVLSGSPALFAKTEKKKKKKKKKYFDFLRSPALKLLIET